MTSDEIVLDGKTYTASKRAASLSGYAQDYIGQLARSGQIDAQRVGGLWYVSMPSLEGYRRNSEAYKPSIAPQNAPKDADTIVSFDGKDYVSASRAAKITGYNQDYVGQLARAGKILSRQVGNRWYVERDGLLTHKSAKDSMLAAVQSDAVGLVRHTPVPVEQKSADPEPSYFTYLPDTNDLMPALAKETSRAVDEAPVAAPNRIKTNPVTIRRTAPTPRPKMHSVHIADTAVRTSGKSISRATKIVAALTVVIVLSYGLSTMKTDSLYAMFTPHSGGSSIQLSMPAAASGAVESIGALLEQYLVGELVYVRQ